jgi:hypothetical protein
MVMPVARSPNSFQLRLFRTFTGQFPSGEGLAVRVSAPMQPANPAREQEEQPGQLCGR